VGCLPRSRESRLPLILSAIAGGFRLIDLEIRFYQVNLLSDKFLCIPHCRLRIIVIVQN